MTEDVSENIDPHEVQLLQVNSAFEKESACYVKFYRYMLIQFIREALDDESERLSSYNFFMRPEGRVICEFSNISITTVRILFKKLMDSEAFREEIRLKVKNRGLRVDKF